MRTTLSETRRGAIGSGGLWCPVLFVINVVPVLLSHLLNQLPALDHRQSILKME